MPRILLSCAADSDTENIMRAYLISDDVRASSRYKRNPLTHKSSAQSERPIKSPKTHAVAPYGRPHIGLTQKNAFDEPGSPRPHRVGAKAVELAENVTRRAGHLNRIVLPTLAAAYAETGRFSEAIDAAQNVLQLAVTQPTGHW